MIDSNMSRIGNDVNTESFGGSGTETTEVGMKEIDVTIIQTIVWEILPENCRTSTTVIGVIGGILVLLGLIFNSVLIAAACATNPKPLVKKSDNAAAIRRNQFKSSLYVSFFIIIWLTSV